MQRVNSSNIMIVLYFRFFCILFEFSRVISQSMIFRLIPFSEICCHGKPLFPMMFPSSLDINGVAPSSLEGRVVRSTASELKGFKVNSTIHIFIP